MAAGARDPDVEQPPFFRQRGGIGGRLPDGQGALLEHRQEDGVPLEALGAMQGRKGDALAGGIGLGRVASGQLGEEVGHRRVGLILLERSCHRQQCAQRRMPVARLGARAGGGRLVESELGAPSGRDEARGAPGSSVLRAARAARTSGRAKKRTPRTVNGMPAPVSAASSGTSCAFVRTRIAISVAVTPPAVNARIPATIAASSPSASAWATSSGSGPRHPRRGALDRESACLRARVPAACCGSSG